MREPHPKEYLSMKRAIAISIVATLGTQAVIHHWWERPDNRTYRESSVSQEMARYRHAPGSTEQLDYKGGKLMVNLAAPRLGTEAITVQCSEDNDGVYAYADGDTTYESWNNLFADKACLDSQITPSDHLLTTIKNSIEVSVPESN